jgi:putative transposase
VGDFQTAHLQRIEQALENGLVSRDDRWSESIAVGCLAFVESVKSDLGSRAMHRAVERKDRAYALRERGEAYNGDFGGESESLRLENTVLWDETLKLA